MFKLVRTFVLLELLLAIVKAGDQDSLAEVESDVEGLQVDAIVQQYNKPPSQTGICVKGFTYLPSTRGCYKVVHESHDWYTATKKCQELHRGSHLAAVTSAEKNSALKTFLATDVSKNSGNLVCLLDGRADSGNAYWTSGQQLIKGNCNSPFVWRLSSYKLQAFEFTNWNRGEPNCGRGEICALIQVYNDFRWTDVHCSSKTCPLCEYTP